MRKFSPRGFFEIPNISAYNPDIILSLQVLPESCILILFGILLGFSAYEIECNTTSSTCADFKQAFVEKDASFSLDSRTFFFYLLPPIVLDAG